VARQWGDPVPLALPSRPARLVVLQTGAIGCAADRRDWLCSRPMRSIDVECTSRHHDQ
jgi:hypothetical protein